MLMLRAYFDESGHSEDPNVRVVAIGGCIAPLEAWERFEPDWLMILRHFCVSALHMKDFAHSQGEFEGWQEDKRRAFLAALLEVMGRDVSAYIGAATSLRLYERLPHLHAGFGDPYYGCFIYCLVHAEKVAAELPAEERVEVICARQPEFSGMALEIFNNYQSGEGLQSGGERLGSIAVASPKTTVPLQAADLASCLRTAAVSNEPDQRD